MYDVAIIGAGVIGTFIARELSRYKLNIVLLEKDNDVANGTTKANSAIIHAGYDAEPGTNMARFNSKGNPMFDKVCEELDVEFKRIGSLVVAFNDKDMIKVKELYERGIKNGIPKMEIIGKEKVREMEPNLNKEIEGALYAPTCGIIGPWELAIALAENAVENGVELLLNSEVKNIIKTGEGYKISTNDQTINAKYVINCAGLFADKINNMVASPSFKITPRRGEYFVLDKTAGNFVNKVVFQCPTELGKGVLVTPTVHGNLLIGPNAEDLDDKGRLDTTQDGLDYVKRSALKTSSKIPFNKVITTFAGLRAQPSTGDFIVEESKEARGFINVAGIKSPGLSSAPAIAEYVVELLKDISGGFKLNQKFNPIRKRIIRFDKLSDEEKKELIRKNPAYGRIICRCENITEGEIIDVIRRKVGARTLDGVKKRIRPGTGRCQGGFCSPRVIEILSRELEKDMPDIVKDSLDSYILTGTTNKGHLNYDIEELSAASIDETDE